MLSETIEAAGYVSFFWLFLFNSKFRAVRIAEWRDGGWLERVFLAFEAGVSTLIGVAVPVVLLWMLFT